MPQSILGFPRAAEMPTRIYAVMSITCGGIKMTSRYSAKGEKESPPKSPSQSNEAGKQSEVGFI